MRLSLALAGILVSAGLTIPFVEAAAAPPPTAEDEARAAADGTVSVSRDAASGRVEFVRATAKGDLAPGVSARSASSAAKAESWLTDHADLFGIESDQLVETRETTSDEGRTVTYAQEYRGLPVWGAALKANLDADGDLRSVNGHVVPDLELSTDPHTTAEQAEARSTRIVRADPPTNDEGDPAHVGDPTSQAELVVYETGSPLGRAGRARLAWDVTVTAGAAVNERVVLDADSLKPLNRFSQAHGALDRTLSSTDDKGTQDVNDDTTSQVWQEGQSTSGLAADQLRLVTAAAETHRLFENAFGVDSYDGAGATMVTLHDRTDSCPNASWNGIQVSYCAGVDSDDIVAHEWGHAYTQYSSGLLYQWQSGALNESYSDVWGETLDLVNGRNDEGEDNAVRADDTCSGRTSDLNMTRDRSVTLTVTAPTARACVGVEAQFGLRLSKAPQQISIVAGTDASNPVGLSTTDGCTALTNAAAVAGKWVLLDRGTCTFARKSKMALAAGARGVLVAETTTEASVSSTGSGVLPLVRIAKVDGDAIRAMSGTVTATVSSPSANDTVRHRWLVGEKSAGFGGALRDMWNPTCLGNPAKVSDAQYRCDTASTSTTDWGRVHSHSGVPNRAYSLFVDGGTFNGQTVAGVGLDKAAQVWWRANAAYLTPTSDFADFAAALTESCRTLEGATIPALSTGAPAGPSAAVTATDCAELAKVVAATELRTDMAERCQFTPYFTSDVPTGCGGEYQSVDLLEQDFEDGWDGWTPGVTPSAGAVPGPTAWTVSDRVSGNAGHAALAANPAECGTDSVAGLSTLTSPTVTLTPGVSPRLRFRHSVYLEDGYDGGQVKIRINDGAWAPISQDAYLANGPFDVVADWPASWGGPSANPLLGQAVWSGGEAQTGASRWGVSVVDLESAGAEVGDTVQVRFDLGTDQCGGEYGWLVDDVTISHCVLPVVVPTTVPTTAPTSAPTTAPTTAPTKKPVVVKKATRTSVKVGPATPRKGKKFRLTVTVTPAASGTVTFTLDGKRLKVVKVSRGKASLLVTAKQSKKLRRGKHVVRVAYSGSSAHKPSTGKRTFTIRR